MESNHQEIGADFLSDLTPAEVTAVYLQCRKQFYDLVSGKIQQDTILIVPYIRGNGDGSPKLKSSDYHWGSGISIYEMVITDAVRFTQML